MANRKVTMTHLRAIIREFKLGTPMREIERKLKISRTSLRPYRDVSSNFVSADFRKMRTDSFQKSRTTRFRKTRVVR